jgi:hypothetical protein
MANTNAPIGFRWHGLGGDGATPSAGIVVATIASTNTNVFGEGDPVMQLSTGFVDAFTRTTAGYALVGIFKACEYYSTAQGRKVYRNYWPGSDATGNVTVHIVKCLGSIVPRFLVQSAGATAVTLANVGMNTDIASGSSTAGTVTSGFYRSNCTTDLVANFSTTSTLPFRIVQLYSDIAAPGTTGSTTNTSYNWVLVEANNYNAQGV